MIFVGVLIVFPLVWTLYLSLTDSQGSVRAATEFTQLSFTNYVKQLKAYKVSYGDRFWLDFLRGKNIRNGALVAVDYRTGDVIAYVGSSNYYGRNTKRMDPKFNEKALEFSSFMEFVESRPKLVEVKKEEQARMLRLY